MTKEKKKRTSGVHNKSEKEKKNTIRTFQSKIKPAPRSRNIFQNKEPVIAVDRVSDVNEVTN